LFEINRAAKPKKGVPGWFGLDPAALSLRLRPASVSSTGIFALGGTESDSIGDYVHKTSIN